jgi:hypothetical protein
VGDAIGLQRSLVILHGRRGEIEIQLVVAGFPARAGSGEGGWGWWDKTMKDSRFFPVCNLCRLDQIGVNLGEAGFGRSFRQGA